MDNLTLDEQSARVRAERVMKNAVVLSNVIEVATNVILNSAGTDISDSIKNTVITRNVVSGMVANRIKEKLIKGEQQ